MRGVHLLIAVLLTLLAAGTIYRAATRPVVVILDEPDQALLQKVSDETGPIYNPPLCSKLPPAVFDAPQFYERETPTPPRRIELPEDLT